MPGFSERQRNVAETCWPWHGGQGPPCSSQSCGHCPGPCVPCRRDHHGTWHFPYPIPLLYWHSLDLMGTCQGGHMAQWPSTVPMPSIPTQGHMTGTGYTAATRRHGGGLGPAVLYNYHGWPWLFVHGMGAQPRPQPGSHTSQTAFAQQCGAPAPLSHCLPLALSSGSAPCCPSLWCNQGSALLQTAMEALKPPAHIHLSAAVDSNSCTHLLGSLSRRTAVVSVLSTERCPHPGLAAAQKPEQATRAATENGTDLPPPPKLQHHLRVSIQPLQR